MLETSNIFWSTQFKTPPLSSTPSPSGRQNGRNPFQVGSGGVSALACADCSEKSKLDIGSAEAIPCLCRRSNLRRPLYPPHPPPTLRGYFPLLRGMSIQDPPKGGFPVREGDDAASSSDEGASIYFVDGCLTNLPLYIYRGIQSII
jgi:hypothetical protein